MPLPMVLATAVPKTKAATKFQKGGQATARTGVRTRVETIVAMELAASCQPLENSKARVRKMTTRRREKPVTGSGALEDDAFDDVGDIFAFVDGGLDDFEDFLPLDDLDRVFFFVEELGDEGAAEAVAFVLAAIDLDTVFQSFLGVFQGVNAGSHLGGGGDQDFDQVLGTQADGVHAVQDEAAGGGIDEVDHVVKPAAQFVDIFAVEGRDEGLVQLGENVVGDFVALMLDGLDTLHLFGDAGGVRAHLKKSFGSEVDVVRMLGEKVKKTLCARQEALQKSRNVERLSPEESG